MKRVLVVGSDMLLREMISSFLVDLPMEVRTAESIGIFEQECRAGVFDLVVMTELAPFFDGSDPSTILRRAGLRRPDLLVISWQHSEWAVLSLLESRVTQYVTFPINIRRVRRKICEILSCEL